MKNEQKNQRIRNSVTVKLALIVALSLLLLIPASMINRMIKERENLKELTETEVSAKWGNEQTFTGPILEVPYTIEIETDKKVTLLTKQAYIVPDQLNITGELIPEIRYRGIYKVIAYRSVLSVNGNFAENLQDEWPEEFHSIQWEKARLVCGISDLRGIDSSIQVMYNNAAHTAKPGTSKARTINSGFYAEVPIDITSEKQQFSFSLNLNGSHNMFFSPLAKETTAEINSKWTSPSFSGAFLPDERDITDSGFVARWNILEMNRSIPHKWDQSQRPDLDAPRFGVELYLPVDGYQKASRSVKYAILFIGLTFLILFFREMLGKVKIHPVQYLIVGSALVIFYSLLIALTEHIGFNAAYGVAAIVITSMIGLYSFSALKKRLPAFIVTASLVLLYSFLFIVLQLSDYALLVGNLGVVIILGTVMYFSRQIDWYAPSKENDNAID